MAGPIETQSIMNRVTDKDFSFKCRMIWDDMEDSANGKFCSKCRKEVFDLTNCSADEVRALQDKHGSICGSIRVAQAAVVALSLSAAACQKVEPTTGTPRRIAPPSNTTQRLTETESEKDQTTNPPKPSTPMILGEICPPKADIPKVDQPAQPPIQPAGPFNPDPNVPRLMGKICPQPLPKPPQNAPEVKIDI
jgi:hypothetical protein